MRTISTDTTHLSDADLRTYIASAALDVYEALLQGYEAYDIAFAAGTLQRFADALLAREPASVAEGRVPA